VKTERRTLFTSARTIPSSSSSSAFSTNVLFGFLRPGFRKCIQLSLIATLFLSLASMVRAQDYPHKWNFNVGGGVGFPQGQLSSFANIGGNFVVGGGWNAEKYLHLNGEFMWHDLPINSATRNALQTPGASARQYSLTFNPMVPVQLGNHFGLYGIGGIGWYHRSGETTTPGTAIICNPYWSWWFGCTIGSVNVITGSTSANAFGENIGGGVTYRLGGSGLKFYTEFRYHHAAYNKVSTNIIPLTFGVRW
jgi:hypothetical protein